MTQAKSDFWQQKSCWCFVLPHAYLNSSTWRIQSGFSIWFPAEIDWCIQLDGRVNRAIDLFSWPTVKLFN